MGARSWIFLRGLTRGAGHWGDFVERFHQNFPGEEVELLDIPGNGFRNQAKSPLSISEYVDDMRAHSLLIKQGRQVHFLALSLGAMIAVEWARRYPQDVAHLLLVSTSSSNWSPLHHRLLPQNYLKAILAVGLKPERREEIILGMVMNNQERIREWLPVTSAHSMAYPVSPVNFIRQLHAASRMKFPNQAPAPCTLIAPEADHLVSVECTKAIGNAWGIKPILHPWAGHDIPLDDPNWMMEKIKSSL